MKCNPDDDDDAKQDSMHDRAAALESLWSLPFGNAREGLQSGFFAREADVKIMECRQSGTCGKEAYLSSAVAQDSGHTGEIKSNECLESRGDVESASSSKLFVGNMGCEQAADKIVCVSCGNFDRCG